MRLGPRLYDRLLRGLPPLYMCLRVSDVREEAARLALELVSADGCGWFDFEFETGPEVLGFHESTPVITAATLCNMPRAIASHPHVHQWLTTADRSARRMSELSPGVRRCYYDENREAYAGIGREHMSAPIAVRRARLTALSYRRDRKPFTDEDILVVNLLRPHLQQALANARAFERMLGRTRVADAVERFGNLTARESEVGFWVAQGKTNREIALILNIAPRTAEKHVEAVLRKLHVENRTAAAFAVRAYLHEPR